MGSCGDDGRRSGERGDVGGGGDGGPRLSARVPRVACPPDGGSGSLPEEARRLLCAGMSCVLEGSRIWPAALERWADAAYLETELAAASCAVLSSPLSFKRFWSAAPRAPSSTRRIVGRATRAPPSSTHQPSLQVAPRATPGHESDPAAPRSYWLPNRKFKTVADAQARGGERRETAERAFSRYAFKEPEVKQLNLSIDEFFRLGAARR